MWRRSISIDKLFKEILHRPADELGLKYFTSKLKHNEMILDEIKNVINESEEARLLRLLRLKQQALPDEDIKKILDNLFIEMLLLHIKHRELEPLLSLYKNKKLTIKDLKKHILNLDEYKKNDYTKESTFQKSEFFRSCTIDEIKCYQNLKKFYEKRGYHTFKFPNGYVVTGKYDMTKFIHHYQIPDHLDGKTVLDIGPATGFFSFEFHKRCAADVVAIDKHNVEWCEDLNKLMQTNVKLIVQDIETLDESFGKFDLVFCSNLLLHTSDIFGNICRIKKVTKEIAIISTILTESSDENIPLAQFLGTPYYTDVGDKFYVYWLPNMNGFMRMAEVAGFTKVEQIADFTIVGENRENVLRQGVIHCYV